MAFQFSGSGTVKRSVRILLLDSVSWPTEAA